MINRNRPLCRKTRISSAIVLSISIMSGCQSTSSTPSVSTSAVAMPEVTISANTDLLTAAQLAFVNDPANLYPFNLTVDKLAVKMAEKSPQQVKALVSAMMSALADRKYDAESQPSSDIGANGISEPLSIIPQTGIVPLNTDAAKYNGSTVLQPAIFDKYKREPGPFSVKRYLNEKGGIPTFANAPVAVRKADLIAGKVDVAFVGVPLALGTIGWRDSKHAPTIMRGMYGLSGYNVAGGVDPTLILSVADYGNIAVNNMSPELNVVHLQEQIEDMASAGVAPFIVGGDQSVMFSTVKAMANQYGKDELTVLHLDAHYRGDRDLDHFYSDNQSVSNLIDQEVISGDHLVQVGLRGASQNKEALTWLRNNKVKYHTMAQVDHVGWPVVMEQVVEEVKSVGNKTFISFNMSAIDPAYVSGAGQPVAGGIAIREAMTTLRRVCAETNVVGFEMLGVTPYLDLSYRTALSANQLMHACLTGIAMRKEGITQSDYLDPMAISHSQ